MNKKINLRNGHGDIIYPNVIDKNNKDILDTVQNNSINIQKLEKQLLHDGNKIDAIISSINDLLYVFQYATLGICLAKAYKDSNNIFVSISMHFIQNFLAAILVLLVY